MPINRLVLKWRRIADIIRPQGHNFGPESFKKHAAVSILAGTFLTQSKAAAQQ